MGQLSQFVQWSKTSGTAVTVGEREIIPEAWTLVVRWPGGGLVWNRPTAVLIRSGAQTERLPMPDVTRWIQLLLLAGITLIWLMGRQRPAAA